MLADFAIVAVLGFFVWRGWRRGLVMALAGLVGFVVAALVAVRGFRPIASVLREGFGMGAGTANLVASLGLFVAMLVLAHLGARALTRLLNLTKWGTLNRAAGGSVAAVWALSWVTGVLLALSVLPVPEAVASQVQRSTLGTTILHQAPGWAARVARTDLREAMRLFRGDEQKVAVIASDDITPDEDTAAALHRAVNRERRARGIPAVRWDGVLAEVSLGHAQDMYRRGYFAHESPEGDGPDARLRRRDVRFSLAGENLALAPSAADAHAFLMRSPEHRAHILDHDLTRLGVGVVYGRQGYMVVQTFTG